MRDDFDIRMMTEEERQDPSLLKQRPEVQETPYAVYYGSEKKELEYVCKTCKNRHDCKAYEDAQIQQEFLRNAVKDKELINHIPHKFSEEELEKLKHNVFIIVKCKFREVE